MQYMLTDKTGTLTEGRPQVAGIVWTEGARIFPLSAILYSMEARSEHPLAGALTDYFMSRGAGSVPLSAFGSRS